MRLSGFQGFNAITWPALWGVPKLPALKAPRITQHDTRPTPKHCRKQHQSNGLLTSQATGRIILVQARKQFIGKNLPAVFRDDSAAGTASRPEGTRQNFKEPLSPLQRVIPEEEYYEPQRRRRSPVFHTSGSAVTDHG
jgi:hypothetical protein